MLIRTLRAWLKPDSPVRSHSARRGSRRLSGIYCPAIDVLEERQMLSATVVGRDIFYNHSRYDSNNVAANAADDAAIATDKQALLPGQTAKFANYTSYSQGINGIMVDVSGLASTPTAADFVFKVGNNNSVASWSAAPDPASINVRPGAGVGGSSRVTITWPDGVIKKQWLQVTVLNTAATGLDKPDIFYFGNAMGDSGNSVANAIVNSTDELAARANPHDFNNPVDITYPLDFNRDSLVNSADEVVARNNPTAAPSALQLIKPSNGFAWSTVVGRNLFYNNSSYDGFNPAAGASDDAAIATNKQALFQNFTATYANYSNYSLGINGIMVDIAGQPQSITAADFVFRVGNDNTPANWLLAPAPSSVTVRPGAGVGGSTRVTIIWPDGAIQRQWLQVTVKANLNTNLAVPDVFYYGNSPGETGDSATNADVTSGDVSAILAALNTSATITSPLDINRDRTISTADVALAAANSAMGQAQLALIRPAVAPPPTPTGEKAYVDFVSADVVGRYVFYNNSAFDNGNPAATSDDDQAIATDKTALLPGGNATFANYTSYTQGINGVMIDIAGLPSYSLTTNDFSFLMGNNSTPGQWATAPAPTSITVRPGAGVNGSVRVTLTWADNAIQNSWLQVTVKSTPSTGLKQADVFYFGNAIGESGNSTADAVVNSTDLVVTMNKPYDVDHPAPITEIGDFNRDRVVNLSDLLAVQNHSTNKMTALQLITTPAAPAATAPPLRAPVNLYNQGDAGYNAAFGPALVMANDGTVLGFAEGRITAQDSSARALLLRRSSDGGATWSAVTVITSVPNDGPDFIGNVAPVVDTRTGDVFLLYTMNNDRVFVVQSSDNGLSWSAPKEITNSVKVTAQGNPNPAAYPDSPWGWYATGPGHGIQIQAGSYSGRMIIPADHRVSSDNSTPSWSHIIYSDDDGATWHLGGGPNQNYFVNNGTNESSVAEIANGALYMNMRLKDNSPWGSTNRGKSFSYDGGMTWSTVAVEGSQQTQSVQGSVIRLNPTTLLLSAPESDPSQRHQMTLWISTNNAQTWTKLDTVDWAYASYSDMVVVGPDTVLLAYNESVLTNTNLEHIALLRINLRWLLSSQPYDFTWNFNEQSQGTRANISGASIQDSSVFTNRSLAVADNQQVAPMYVAGPGSNTALRLTSSSDAVQLTPKLNYAMQFTAAQSFTIQLSMRTTDTSGVIIGSRHDIQNYAIKLVNGFVQFSVSDNRTTASLLSSVAINDGNWHTVAVIRDASARTLKIYIDGVQSGATAADTTTLSPLNGDAVMLGAYEDGTGQLAFDVDTLRVSRYAVSPAQLMPLVVTEPPRSMTSQPPLNAPTSIPGLQFWLPAYDPTRDYTNLGFSDPVPVTPVLGTTVHSAVEASPNQFQVSTAGVLRPVFYANDPIVGANWLHTPSSAEGGREWIVRDSNGTDPSNFDFVQNTGVFTLSMFIKPGASLGTDMTLFDTQEGNANKTGFNWTLTRQGALRLQVTGEPNSPRINVSTADGLISSNQWYQIVVVGNGAGNPVQFYITPVSQTTVSASSSSVAMTGVDGSYPTDANHNLNIGSTSNTLKASYNGQMVDQAIYNRALTPAEVQKLFNFTTKRA